MMPDDTRIKTDGRQRLPLRRLLGILGPGLVTGAADDDPSGIATYSQTGAQFGYGQLWTALWMLPLVTGVQEACGWIGNITGQGLAHNIKERYSLHTLRLLVVLLLAANDVNIGADVGAIGAAAALIIPLPAAVLMVAFTAVILILEIFVSYRRYAKALKWLTVALLARCFTPPTSPPSTPRPTRPGRSSRWSRASPALVSSPRPCSPSASSPSACSPSPSWPDPAPTPSARPAANRRAWSSTPPGPRTERQVRF
jgi:hypothetical protein